jgi:hypothetical protein
MSMGSRQGAIGRGAHARDRSGPGRSARIGSVPDVSEILTIGSAFVQTVHATLGIRGARSERAGVARRRRAVLG